jgi:catechol 2,3-dioxygenase-like lactoylglutathione lyase family enzyme
VGITGGLLHVIIYVQDMDAQVRFYRDMLGLDITFPQGLSSYKDEFWVEFETGTCSLVLHGGGQKRLGQGTPKLAFTVTDIDAARALLLERGVKMGDIRSPAPGVRVADGFDPEGSPFSIDWHESVTE